MSAMASQITSLTIVYPTVYSDADQRKYQSSASLAFVRGIHRWPVNSPHQGPVTRKSVPIWWRHHGVSPAKHFPNFSHKIIITMASHKGLGLPTTPLIVQQLVQVINTENITPPHYWPSASRNHGRIPLTKGQQCKNVAIPWRHHGIFFTVLLLGNNVAETPVS